MKYIILLVFLILIIGPSLTGQELLLRTSADSFMLAYRNDNFEYCALKAYQPIVEMAGGSEAFIRNSKNIAMAWKNAGFETTRLEFNHTTPYVEAGSEWHAIVSYDVEYNLHGNIFTGSIYLLAISTDLGAQWSFLNLESYDKESISDFIPNYNHTLPFPIISGPVIKE